jgi:hypothetical protein
MNDDGLVATPHDTREIPNVLVKESEEGRSTTVLTAHKI